MMTSKKSFTISALVHILAFALIFLPVGKQQDEQNNGNSGNKEEVKKEIVPPASTAVSVEIKYKEKNGVKKQNKSDCPDYFGGIGVSLYGTFVFEVYKGYPADGKILPGDEVLTVDDTPYFSGVDIKGEIGTPVFVTVKRDNEKLNFMFIRAKICVKGK